MTDTVKIGLILGLVAVVMFAVGWLLRLLS